jgi:hypothetical protein
VLDTERDTIEGHPRPNGWGGSTTGGRGGRGRP